MRKIIAQFLILSTVLLPSVLPFNILSAATQSADLERGSSQYFNRGDNSLYEGGASFSIECWGNLESASTGAAFNIMSHRGGATDKSYVFKVNDAGNMALQASSNGSSFDGDTTVSWTEVTGTWKHFGVTFDGGANEVKFYVDFTQQGTTQAPGISSVHDASGDFSIGREAGGGDYFDGKLFMCRFWQEVRTAQEFEDNACTALGSTTNLSAEYVFDGDATDNSGNGLNLTEVNTPTYVSDIPESCATSPEDNTNSQFF